MVSANYQALEFANDASLILSMYGGMGIGYIPSLSAETLSSSGEPGNLSPSRVLAAAPLSKNPLLAKSAALAGALRQSAAVRDVFAAFWSGPVAMAPMTYTGTVLGSGGGSYTYTYTEDIGTYSGTYSISITFSDYRDAVDLTEINGTLIESGSFAITESSSSLKMTGSITTQLGTSAGVPLTTKGYSLGFASLVDQESARFTINMGLSYTQNISGDVSASATLSVPSGSMSHENYFESYTESLVFNKMTIVVGETAEAYGTMIALITANGGCAYSTTEPGTAQDIDISYSNFKMGLTTDYSGTFQDTTIDGRFSVSFDPALACTGGASFAGGTYSFETITPVHYNYGSGSTTAGEIVINGVATVLYNANGTVTVTVGDSSEPFPSESIMESYCWI